MPKAKKLSAPYHIEEVQWNDTHEDSNEWQHGEPTIAPVLVRTVGHLFSETKSHLILVRDYYLDEAGQPVTGGRIAIPRGMIAKRTVLK